MLASMPSSSTTTISTAHRQGPAGGSTALPFSVLGRNYEQRKGGGIRLPYRMVGTASASKSGSRILDSLLLARATPPPTTPTPLTPSTRRGLATSATATAPGGQVGKARGLLANSPSHAGQPHHLTIRQALAECAAPIPPHPSAPRHESITQLPSCLYTNRTSQLASPSQRDSGHARPPAPRPVVSLHTALQHVRLPVLPSLDPHRRVRQWLEAVVPGAPEQ